MDVKILLMDAVSTPAVVRTALESPENKVRELLAGLGRDAAIDVFRQMNLFTDISSATLIGAGRSKTSSAAG